MAFEVPVLLIPGLKSSSTSLATKQYYFMKLDSSGDVVVCSAATDKPIGVLQNNPAGGETAAVMALGITRIVGDALLAVGDLIGTSADGQADAKTPGTDITEYLVGTVLKANGAAGDLATAMVNCINPLRAA